MKRTTVYLYLAFYFVAMIPITLILAAWGNAHMSEREAEVALRASAFRAGDNVRVLSYGVLARRTDDEFGRTRLVESVPEGTVCAISSVNSLPVDGGYLMVHCGDVSLWASREKLGESHLFERIPAH